MITGCGHAGIVNITRYTLALTGASQVYGVFGGFHLNGPMFEPLIDRMRRSRRVCLPITAPHALARTFGEAYVPDCVGTQFTL